MKIGIAGMGAIGLRIAEALDQGEIPGSNLAGFCARNDKRAEVLNRHLSKSVPNYALTKIANHCDLVIEALPPTLFEELATAVLQAGKTLVVLSASQLLGRQDLIDLATQTGAKIVIPSGAILGLDAIKGAAEGTIEEQVRAFLDTETAWRRDRLVVCALPNPPYTSGDDSRGQSS